MMHIGVVPVLELHIPQLKRHQQVDQFLLLFSHSSGLSCLIFENCSKSSIIHENNLSSFCIKNFDFS